MDFYAEPMNTAIIRNEEFLDLLNEYSDLVQTIDIDKVGNYNKDDDADWYTGDDYRKQIIYKGREHFGYPESSMGFELRAEHFRYADIDKQVELAGKGEQLVDDVCIYLGAHRKALSMVYPPKGYIGWHNNANAPGFNIIFTWSESGDGQWEHIDPKTKEHVVIPDVKGWQCKYGYYGTYEEPDRLLYHAAKTNCLRTTIAFVFNGDERGKAMAENVIEEIETA